MKSGGEFPLWTSAPLILLPGWMQPGKRDQECGRLWPFLWAFFLSWDAPLRNVAKPLNSTFPLLVGPHPEPDRPP